MGRRIVARAATGELYGLVLEADCVAIDLHDDGHRPAFNRAFKVLEGLATPAFCINWWSAPSLPHQGSS